MIIKTSKQAERFTNNLLDIGIAYYGGGDLKLLLSRCKNSEAQGSTLHKIYVGMYDSAVRMSKDTQAKIKLELIIDQALEHYAVPAI